MQESTGISQLPRVKRMRGAQITHGMEAVNIQYKTTSTAQFTSLQ